MRTILILAFLTLGQSAALAQHLRIFACAIANDSSGAFMGGSSNGSGLYQSDDTGKTWKHVGWDNIKCYSMDEVQSSNGRILYEATGFGILRSTDYGAHWKQLTDWRISEAMDVAVNQKNPNEIYIATAHGPWRSEDGGKSWNELLGGSPVPYCSRIVIDSVQPDRILLASEDGIFLLTANGWQRIQADEWNTKGAFHSARGVRSITQISKWRWIAAAENSRVLISDGRQMSFGSMSFGMDTLWTAVQSGKSPASGELIIVTGGARGIGIVQWNGDVVHTSVDTVFKNTSSILDIPMSYKYGHGYLMVGTLGQGIYRMRGSTIHTLDGRQIWTLKSFLVTP